MRSLLLACGLITSSITANAQTILIDNTDGAPGYTETGGWSSSSTGPYIGTNARVASTGGGLDTASWNPDFPVAGPYEVQVWYVGSNSSYRTTVPYTVKHSLGSTTTFVDQTQVLSSWLSLGTFEFSQGRSAIDPEGVTVSDQATASGVYASADAAQFIYSGTPLPGSCSEVVTDLVPLSSSASCNSCAHLLLPGAVVDRSDFKYHIISDLPERFLSPGVLYSTQDVLPPDPSYSDTNNLRTQTKNSGFTTIDDNFEAFLFHITSPGNGLEPRRIVVYVRNDGAEDVTITPRQIIITDGIIGTVHEMESTLGARVMDEDWDTPVAPLTIPSGTGNVIAYSKQFGRTSAPNPSDQSVNINCFGRIQAEVSGNNPDLKVFVVAIPAELIANNKSLAESNMAQAAETGETAIDLTTAPSGCALRRASGVFRNFQWKSDPIIVDINQLPSSGNLFQMALPEIQSGGCTTARQTRSMLLHPGFVRNDTIGNYMIDYRVTLRLVNRHASEPRRFDLQFGKTGADIGLAWKVVAAQTPPDEVTVDAATTRTGWAGPNQLGLTHSFLNQDGGPIQLAPCEAVEVGLRFQILGNASLPFQFHIVPEEPEISAVHGWMLLVD